MALNNFTEDEWVKIARESDEIGYCLIAPTEVWKPERHALDEKAISEGYIKMETGILSLKRLRLLLNHLPVDLTFIDQDDVVRYFSHGKERIFARTKAGYWTDCPKLSSTKKCTCRRRTPCRL